MTVTAALLWASSFTVVRVGLRYGDPYTLVLLRFAAASAMLLALALRRGHGRSVLRCLTDRYAVLLGLTLSASFGFQFRGQVETTAAKTAMIINSSVLLVAPLSVIFLKEHMGWRKLVALAVGLAGVVLITHPSARHPGEMETVTGNLLVAVSSVSYGCYVVFTKLAVTRRDYRDIPLITAVFLWSLPAYLIAALPGLLRGKTPGAGGWLAVLYMALFCSVIPFVLWTGAIRHIGALTSAIVLLAELVFGVSFAALFLREGLTGRVLTGCGLICLGILILAGRKGRRRPAATAAGSRPGPS
jgi:drug/metabolite transporter (DMT)-like permease